MVRAWILFFCRVCYAVFENDRHGLSGMTGMFGGRTEYLDGSIGFESEASVAITGKELKPGIAYATASVDGRPLWMLQVDGESTPGRILELVSHVMDAGDTSALLILEHSMNLLLKQFTTVTDQEIPLKTVVENYNNVIVRMNDDPDWKVMKMPTLHFTNAAPNAMSAQFFERWAREAENSVDRQINFGVPVDTFTPSRFPKFLSDHTGGDDALRERYAYQLLAVNVADMLAKAFSTKTNLQFSPDEQGILALMIGKTIGKRDYFPRREITHNRNHMRAMTADMHTAYKNYLGLVPKVNMRTLILAMPADGALRRLVSDRAFLAGLSADGQKIREDILRLMDRNTLAVTPGVDDDCFVDVNRVFPPQRHSDGRLAIVMEARFPGANNVQMVKGSFVEVRSVAESVKRYQTLYGDLRVDSDLRPFQNFEVAIALTKLPEYSRVTLDFEGVDTGVIQKYVVPLAKDTQFLRSLRSVIGIHHIKFVNRAEIFAISGHVLSINGGSLKRGRAATDLRKALKSHIDQNSQRELNAGLKQISELARKYDVQLPTDVGSEHLDFDTLLNLRSQFVEKAIQKIQGVIRYALWSVPTNIEDTWASFNMQISRSQNRGEPGFLMDGSLETPLNDDMRLTLDMWLDAGSDMNILMKYHEHDKVMMNKFDLLNREMDYFRGWSQYCSIL